ncbi:MAG: hypothetical protein IPP74_00255 [Alphaproteobacteria bacterium]|nr:hypothetical protein [Alphaproteobacteria bacterium]
MRNQVHGSVETKKEKAERKKITNQPPQKEKLTSRGQNSQNRYNIQSNRGTEIGQPTETFVDSEQRRRNVSRPTTTNKDGQVVMNISFKF